MRQAHVRRVLVWLKQHKKMSPKDYGIVKTHHKRLVASARQGLATDPTNPILRRKLAVELLALRSLRSHWDLNTYLTIKPTLQ